MKTRILYIFCCVFAFSQGCVDPFDDFGPLGDIESGQSLVTVELPAFVESEHPYANDLDREWWIEASDMATDLILPFDRVELEWGYDYLVIYDGQDQTIAILTGNMGAVTVQVPGKTARIRLITDASVQRYGVLLSRYQFVKPVDEYTDHRPVCREIGAYAEGWYWADTGAFIRSDHCGASHEAECVGIGSRSEGWSADGEFIVWDRCHQTVGLSLASEACEGESDLFCFGELYCAELHGDGHPGVCRILGSCSTDADCSAPGNDYIVPACVGHATCEQNVCAWHCDSIPVGNKGWVTYLVRDLESEHPYGNDLDDTQTQTFAGAEKFKLYFHKLETEVGYDHVNVWGMQEMALFHDGLYEQYWTPEIMGDTVWVSLHSDRSVTAYGYQASQVSIYTTVPEGQCTEAAHCAAGERCEPLRCFNPYAPCFGFCVPEEAVQSDFENIQKQDIPDDDPAGIESSLYVSQLPVCLLQVHVDVSIRHSYIGDLVVALTEPGGTRVVLHDRAGFGTDDLLMEGFAFPEDFTKEGNWTLSVSDNEGYDTGTLNTWSLHFSCRDE